MLGTDVVKLLIFDNRIVIESPGCLPGDLTVEKIQLGCAEIRNPLITQLCAKTMPYRGLGSGITRALMSGERIDLYNDVERDKFVATIWREGMMATSDANMATSEVNMATSDANMATSAAKKRLSTQEMRELVLKACSGWVSLEEIAVKTSRDSKYLRNFILPKMISENIIEMSYPETPNHPKQKYRRKD